MGNFGYIFGYILFLVFFIGNIIGYLVGYYQRKHKEPRNIQELIDGWEDKSRY